MMTIRRSVLAALLLVVACSDDDSSATDYITITIPRPTAPAALLAIVPGKTRVDAGETTQLGIVATDAQHRPVAAPAVEWRSSQADVASISSSGRLTALSPGYVAISATGAGLRAEIMVHVQRNGVYPDGLAIDPASSSVSACGSLQLFARTVPDVLSTRFEWRSSDTLTAAVDAAGRVRGRAPGPVSITAIWLPDTSRRAVRALVVTDC